MVQLVVAGPKIPYRFALEKFNQEGYFSGHPVVMGNRSYFGFDFDPGTKEEMERGGEEQGNHLPQQTSHRLYNI